MRSFALPSWPWSRRKAGSRPPDSGLLSDQLRARLARCGQDGAAVTLGELVDVAREQGFGLLFAVLALPTLIPVLPPGTAAAIGLVFAILGLQRALGMDHPWLPARIRHIELGPRAAEWLRDKALPHLVKLERVSSQRRLSVLLTEPVLRGAALSVSLLGLLMFTPLPFFNTLPAVVVLTVGIGFLRRDGLFVLAGAAAGLVLTVVIVALLARGTLALFSRWLA